MMDHSGLFILLTIMLAYSFDFINGFHDAGNAIATIVTTGVLKPWQAVCWSAFFNFIAFAFFSLMVANTIGQGIVTQNVMNPHLIFAALTSAITWGIITWYYGLPASSSHALIGGLGGAAMIQGGIHVLQAEGLIKVAIGIFFSPIIGVIVSAGLTRMLHFMETKNLFARHSALLFKSMQLISSALLSLAHGGNDAQKTMGIIAILLFSSHWIIGDFYVPFWVIVSCNLMMSLGTLCGGWRIINTMGTKITQLTQSSGASAQTSAALIIFAATEFGIPVSTTQTVTGAITGVGLSKHKPEIQWRNIRIIFTSWILTLPTTAMISAIIMKLMNI